MPDVNELVREVVFELTLQKAALELEVVELRDLVKRLEARAAATSASSEGASSPQEVETT